MSKPHSFTTHEACGSSRLQVFQQDDGSLDGYCFGCGTVVKHPYPDGVVPTKPTGKAKSPEEIQAELDEISSYRCLDLPLRGLKQAALNDYGVKIGVSEVDGVTPESYYFPRKIDGEVKGYKCGLFSLGGDGKKRMWSIGETREADLFGWDLAVQSGARRLFITEGEFDAIALYQIIRRMQHGTDYQDNMPAVISVPHGAGNAPKDLARVADKINRHFKEVVLVFDNDEKGKAGEEKVLRSFPTWMSVELPKKDANKCLLDGHIKKVFNLCMFKAEKPKNTRLVSSSSLAMAAKTPPLMGLTTPYPTLTKTIRGIRTGETWYIGGGVKMG